MLPAGGEGGGGRGAGIQDRVCECVACLVPCPCVCDILCVSVALGVCESDSRNRPKCWATLTWFSSQPPVQCGLGQKLHLPEPPLSR